MTSSDNEFLYVSPFLRCRPRQQGGFRIYHTCLGKLADINKEGYLILERFRNGASISKVADDLGISKETIYSLAQGFLKRDFFSKTDDPDLLLKDFEMETVARHDEVRLRLVITERCNFRCTYCFENPYLRRKARHMNVNTAIEALSMFRGFFQIDDIRWEKIKVILFGGEPLFNPETLKAVIEKVKTWPETAEGRLQIRLNTNGSLFTKDIVHYLIKNRVFVFLSLDGPPSYHDVHRRDAKGNGTFETVMDGLKLFLSETDVNYAQEHLGILSTHTDMDIESVIPFLDLLAGLGLKNLSFNKAALCNQRIPLDRSDNGFYERFFKNALRIYQEGKARGINIGGMWGHIRNCFKQGSLAFCPAVGNEFTVSPDREIYPCPMVYNEPSHLIGRFKGFSLPVMNENYENWRLRVSSRIPLCRECDFLGICRGGCPAISYWETGDLMSPQGCILYKNFAEYFLDNLPD